MTALALQDPQMRARDGVSPGAGRRYKGGRTVGDGRTGQRQAGFSMSKDELVIQLIKVALGILIGGYFLWWSLQVLERLPPPH